MKVPSLFLFLFISLFSFAQTRYIHVVVALCDNKNQGIVPVPAGIGDGQDPTTNLYWGCGYGVKTFFKKQADWKLIKKTNNSSSVIYERLIFKHKTTNIYLVADAYDGAEIKQTITDFLTYSAGLSKIKIQVDSFSILAGGNADLIAYVGHNGLMDFSLKSYPSQFDTKKREVIILACASKNYFSFYIKKTGAYPLLWTTHLMCPEAYTLDASIDAWIKKENPAAIREKAAQVYHQYQKCGIRGARKLLVTGY